MRKKTQEEAIAKMQEIHGDTYNYSKFEYKGTHTNSTIICKVHGEFEMCFGSHINQKQGCKICGYEKNAKTLRLTQEEFVTRSKIVHSNKYSYEDSVYTGNGDSVIITCPTHGDFKQLAGHHLNGSGCRKCYNDRVPFIQRDTKEDFIIKAKAVHGDKFYYTKVVYHNCMTKVEIVCPVHGSFWQIPNDHTSKKAGCAACAGVKRYTTTDFTTLAAERHNGLYTYENTDYNGTEEKVWITCKKHGDFLQSPHDHLQGAGCPSCGANGCSIGEKELTDFVKSLGFGVETKDRSIIKPYEIDIIIPSLNIGLEYNGIYYHSDKFERVADHKFKTDKATEAGYRLLHIYEDDWRDRRPVVEKTLKHILGVSEVSLYARNLIVAKKSYKECKDFYEANHIQGSGNGESWCLMNGNNVVAAMQFSMSSSERGNTDTSRWELIRFASSVRVVGGASRLFSAFVKDNPSVSTIISYSDNDLFTGEMYNKLGFGKHSDVKPDYKIVVGNKRVHKSNFRKSKIDKYYPEVYDENLSEREMCEKLGYYRIYNSGLTKWLWTKP